MNWRDLRSRIEWAHREDPSKQVLLDACLRQIEDCLGALSREGHHFHLSEGAARHEEYPKTVYHYRRGQREVRSSYELIDLGPGWHLSPRDAELAEGLDIQFAGRGGVRRLQTPAPTGAPLEDLMPEDWKERAKEDFLASRPLLGPIVSDSKAGEHDGTR